MFPFVSSLCRQCLCRGPCLSVCLCGWGWEGALLLPQACPVGFRLWVWGWEGKRRMDLGSFPGFSCAPRRGTLAPQAGPAHPIRVSTESVLYDLGPHPHKGWLSWDPKPSFPGILTQGGANEEWSENCGTPDWWADGQALAVGGAKVPPSHRPRASLQCTACGRSGGPGACAPAAAGGGPGAGCGPACPPSTAARPARVPSCRLNSAVWPPARVSSAKGLLGRRCPAGWGDRET